MLERLNILELFGADKNKYHSLNCQLDPFRRYKFNIKKITYCSKIVINLKNEIYNLYNYYSIISKL